ncbi:MAG: hypothetical protein ACYCSB_01360 [bacterium]|jgi:hypothetical protein
MSTSDIKKAVINFLLSKKAKGEGVFYFSSRTEYAGGDLITVFFKGAYDFRYDAAYTVKFAGKMQFAGNGELVYRTPLYKTLSGKTEEDKFKFAIYVGQTKNLDRL